MQIFVKNRKWIEKQLELYENWYFNKYVISIYSSNDISPFPDRYNILKLQFDDITDEYISNSNCILFNDIHAKLIHNFIKLIKSNLPFYIHCDAGISRSGAIGYMLNEYFNKFINENDEDNMFFINENKHILPNPFIISTLKRQLFKTDYNKLFK